MHRYVYLTLITLLSVSSLFAQNNLPRQGFWGVYPVPVPDSIMEAEGLVPGQGVLLRHVVPNSTEAKVGMEAGDILLEVNGKKLLERGDVRRTGIRNLREGDKVTYVIRRNGKSMKMKGKVLPKPFETSSHGEVLYSQVPFDGGQLRTIITRPNTGKAPFPTLFFIPGYNCASYDNLPAWHPYARVIDSLTGLGYAVFRIEKSGTGDCQNTPSCFEMDFHQEQKVWHAGFGKLADYDFVDQDNIFLFGHSLGGFQAPVLARDMRTKGVAIYGSSHLPWSEYLTLMLRFQNPRMGVDYLENEKDLKLYKGLLYDHYVLGKPVQEIAKNPEYKRVLERDFQYDGDKMIFNRHEKFWRDLENLNMTKVWSEVDGYVLSLYGEADFEAVNSESHREVVRIVNTYHPGKAEFQLVEGTSHSMIKVGSMEDGVKAQNSGLMRQLYRTSFNYDIITRLDTWMQKCMKGL